MPAPATFDLPGHQIRKVLKHLPKQGRTVLLTRYASMDCVTRVWHSKVGVHEHEYLHRIAAGHAAFDCPFPPNLVSDLEGYRVRASLGKVKCLPEVVNVGLARRGFGAEGRPYISTRWIEGRPLHATWQGFDLDTRKRVLRQVLRALAELHSHNVLHGDVKAENVVVGETSVALIDLDTLRKVPDRYTSAAVTQITALYSSPEQSHEREAYLASDLFAYGVMVSLLLANCRPGQPGFPPRLDTPWDTVLEACLREKPLDRPSAVELLQILGESVEDPAEDTDSAPAGPAASRDEVTVRVPDAAGTPRAPHVVALSATERVGDRGSAVLEPSQRGRARTRRLPRLSIRVPALWTSALPRLTSLLSRRRRWAGVAALLALLFVLINLVGGGSSDRSPRASSEAAQLRKQLQLHKTELAHNNRDFLAPIVDAARDGVNDDGPDDVWGAYALARVWQQGWQYTGAAWHPGMFSEGDALTGEAIARAKTGDALLARAILTGAACRLGPATHRRRADHCAESRLRSAQALQVFATEADADWLRVEALWNAALVERAEAQRIRESGRGREAGKRLAVGQQHCLAARDLLHASPVNGVELAEDCLVIAAQGYDAETWLWWVNWMLAHAVQAGKDRSNAEAHVFWSVDPVCAEHPTDRFRLTPRRPGRSALAYCGYVTNLALGWPDRAVRFVCAGGSLDACELPPATREVRWDFAADVRDRVGRSETPAAGLQARLPR